MVVVLPTPLTPTVSTTNGLAAGSMRSGIATGRSMAIRSARNAASSALASLNSRAFMRLRRSSTSAVVAGTPTSAVISAVSSSSSRSSSSLGLRENSPPKLRAKPLLRSRSRQPGLPAGAAGVLPISASSVGRLAVAGIAAVAGGATGSGGAGAAAGSAATAAGAAAGTGVAAGAGAGAASGSSAASGSGAAAAGATTGLGGALVSAGSAVGAGSVALASTGACGNAAASSSALNGWGWVREASPAVSWGFLRRKKLSMQVVSAESGTCYHRRHCRPDASCLRLLQSCRMRHYIKRCRVVC
jgi:hypothetical protein